MWGCTGGTGEESKTGVYLHVLSAKVENAPFHLEGGGGTRRSPLDTEAKRKVQGGCKGFSGSSTRTPKNEKPPKIRERKLEKKREKLKRLRNWEKRHQRGSLKTVRGAGDQTQVKALTKKLKRKEKKPPQGGAVSKKGGKKERNSFSDRRETPTELVKKKGVGGDNMNAKSWTEEKTKKFMKYKFKRATGCLSAGERN